MFKAHEQAFHIFVELVLVLRAHLQDVSFFFQRIREDTVFFGEIRVAGHIAVLRYRDLLRWGLINGWTVTVEDRL